MAHNYDDDGRDDYVDDRPTRAECEAEERYFAAQREMEDEYRDRFAPTATPGEAHAEWHRNSGNPMGTPGCPQDACHPIEDFEPEPEPGEGVRCAHCKRRHWTVADVRACAS